MPASEIDVDEMASPTETLGLLLGASAYRSHDRIREYRDLIMVLAVIHSPLQDIDPRCRTCRDSRGRPAPWPCIPDLLAAAATGHREIKEADLIALRNAGRYLNGQKPLPDSGLRRELGPLLKQIHAKHGFEWADPDRLPR